MGQVDSLARQRPSRSSNEDFEQLARAFDTVMIGMSLLSPDNEILSVNQSYCDFVGYSREEVMALSFAIVHPDDVDEDLRQRARLLRGEARSYWREKRYTHRSGRELWAEYRCTLVRDVLGKPLHFIAQVQDITDRKRAELELQLSEARLEAMFQLSSDWYWEEDADHRLVRVQANRRTPADFHERLPRMLGKTRWSLPWPMRPLKGTWDDFRAILAARQPFFDFEYGALDDPDGVIMSVSGEPFLDAEGHFGGYRGTTRDITAMRRAEWRLARSERLLNIAASVASIGGWTHELGAERSQMSNEAAHILGVSVHPTLEEALSRFAASQRQEVRDALDDCVRFGRGSDLTCQTVEMAPGGSRWVRLIAEPEWGADGRVRRLYGAVQDVTPLKQAQQALAELNQSLEQKVNERTAELQLANNELQRFAHSIAHDLRGPITAMAGFTRLLQEGQAQEPPRDGTHYLKRLADNVRTMDRLTDDLLHLARLSSAEVHEEVCDLSALAAECVRAQSANAPERATDIRIQPDLHVRGDRRMLRDALARMIDNAWKFSKHCEVVRIEIGRTAAGAEPAFYVRDAGVGFDMAHSARVFEPFQRLHHAGEFEGTGIGLAIVRKVIERHRGRVWIDSTPAQGTTVFFALPLA